MASNVKAAKARKQDRTHVSQGHARAHAAALQRKRQQDAEYQRMLERNEELRAQRRDNPDPLDTSYQIERYGGVAVEDAQEGQDYTQHAYIPFSFVEREGDDPDEDANAARARGVRGQIQPHSKPVLIDEGGVPRMKENVLERIDPSDRLMRRALHLFAQQARTKPKLSRRFVAVQIARQNGEVAGRTKPSVATLSIIGRQMGVSRATAANYLREGRAYMQGCLDMAQEMERERA